MKRYVLGFYLTRSGAILIQKTKPEWQKGKWNGLGGHIEVGESPVAAMVREFEEEAGFQTVAADWREIGVLSQDFLSGVQGWEMTIFYAFGELPLGYYPRDTDEGLVCHLISTPYPMDSTAAWLLPMCRDMHNHNMKFAYSHPEAS